MQHADWVQGPNQYQQNQQANGNISTKDAQANGAPSGARKRRPRTVPASYTSTSGGSGKRASFSGTLPDGEYICNRCGHVVRDFESAAKTRYNFQFR